MNITPPIFPTLNSSFRICIAISDAEKLAVYQFRHAIYCEELGYEPYNRVRIEMDEHDEHAIHVMAIDKASGHILGVTRLVTLTAAPQQPLPMEIVCLRSFASKGTARSQMAEVSRFAITPQMRRRHGEQSQPVDLQDSDFGGKGLKRFPALKAALFVGAVAVAAQLGLERLLMLTTPNLARYIRMMGAPLECLGEGVAWHGERRPYAVMVAEIMPALPPSLATVSMQIGERHQKPIIGTSEGVYEQGT